MLTGTPQVGVMPASLCGCVACNPHGRRKSTVLREGGLQRPQVCDPVVVYTTPAKARGFKHLKSFNSTLPGCGCCAYACVLVLMLSHAGIFHLLFWHIGDRRFGVTPGEMQEQTSIENWLWRHDDPKGYRSFWQRSHWNVLSILIHQCEAVLLDQAVLCSLLVTSRDVRAAILEGSCRGQACIRFEGKSDLKRVRRFSLWLQRHAQVMQELQLQLGHDWKELPDLHVGGQ